MAPTARIPFILRARVVKQLSKKRLWLLCSARCLHSRAATREHFYKSSYFNRLYHGKDKNRTSFAEHPHFFFFPGYMPNFRSLGLTRNNLLNLLINRMQFWLHFYVLLPNHIKIISLILNSLSVALTSFCVLLSTDVRSVAIVEIFWAASRLLSMGISIAVTKNIDIFAFEQYPWWCSCLCFQFIWCDADFIVFKVSVLYN